MALTEIKNVEKIQRKETYYFSLALSLAFKFRGFLALGTTTWSGGFGAFHSAGAKISRGLEKEKGDERKQIKMQEGTFFLARAACCWRQLEVRLRKIRSRRASPARAQFCGSSFFSWTMKTSKMKTSTMKTAESRREHPRDWKRKSKGDERKQN